MRCLQVCSVHATAGPWMCTHARIIIVRVSSGDTPPNDGSRLWTLSRQPGGRTPVCAGRLGTRAHSPKWPPNARPLRVKWLAA